MPWITTLDALLAHYRTPGEAATVKVTPVLTPAYRACIDRTRFCVLTTVGPEGTDVTILDDVVLSSRGSPRPQGPAPASPPDRSPDPRR